MQALSLSHRDTHRPLGLTNLGLDIIYLGRLEPHNVHGQLPALVHGAGVEYSRGSVDTGVYGDLLNLSLQ